MTRALLRAAGRRSPGAANGISVTEHPVSEELWEALSPSCRRNPQLQRRKEAAPLRYFVHHSRLAAVARALKRNCNRSRRSSSSGTYGLQKFMNRSPQLLRCRADIRGSGRAPRARRGRRGRSRRRVRVWRPGRLAPSRGRARRRGRGCQPRLAARLAVTYVAGRAGEQDHPRISPPGMLGCSGRRR
ncbi:MAG: hypothetical protein AVDCRST_MAG55-907 [uncultured Rubrobacteraceae bacterium]|uniref:Uncharacterized protein n=1 Tax=uncultured Rubrobacteraceae bacterium TaxID=349277 RepID=A0A6J4P5T1_9ACTN|nr:MAG: hypothetical protein AVDCRST_MAG55-907 [uncultured Rubrobacteraceae bacterium]